MISFSPEQRFIVAGAAGGIGQSVALLLNELGAGVIATDLNLKELLAVRNQAKNPEKF